MSQISAGTAKVTNGSASVVASANADWGDALVALGQGSPVYFSLVGPTEIPRQVITLTTPNVSTSGNWELTLQAAWSGTTQLAALYIIHKDFTANLQLPLFSPNDKQVGQLLSRAFITLDVAIFNQNLSFPTPSDDTGIGAPGITSVLPLGKTLYTATDFEIPLGSTFELSLGSALVVA
jgi:hypothetical protein